MSAQRTTIDRTAIDRARAAMCELPAGNLPGCTAPFATMVLDPDGAVRVCEAASRPLLAKAGADLHRSFQATEFAALRGDSSRGELPDEHCAACLRKIELGVPEQASLVRDHGVRLPMAPAKGPSHLLIRLGPDEAPGGDRLVKQVESLLDDLTEIEVEGDDPLRHPAFQSLAKLLRTRPEDARPDISIRLEGPHVPKHAKRLLNGLTVSRVRLRYGEQLERQLEASSQLLSPTGELVVYYLLDHKNWFDIHSTAVLCATWGATVDLRASDPDGFTPIAALGASDLQALNNLLGSIWYLFSDAARPTSMRPGAFSALRDDVRKIALAETRAILDRVTPDSEGVREGASWRADSRGTVGLRMPPLDHALLTDPMLGVVLYKGSLGMGDSVELARWAERSAATPGFHDLLQSCPWLRLILQKLAVSQSNGTALAELRALYTNPEARERLLNEERALARDHDLDRAVAGGHDWLGVTRIVSRERPFLIPDRTRRGKPDTSKVDVTVLVPSYKHEDYIEECLNSVLSQSYPHFRLLVVDDASPDATVERARSLSDERLEIRTNKVNVGLGDSVLAALEHVDTPFVALLNSDDSFHPKRLAECRRALLADDTAQAVATGLSLVDAAGGEITVDNANRLIDGPQVYDWAHWYRAAQPATAHRGKLFGNLLEHNFLATSTNLFCRRDFLVAQEPALRGLEYCLDWHLFLQAASTGSLRYLPRPLATYRLHASNTVWFQTGRRWKYFLEVNRVAATALRGFLAQHLSEDSDTRAGRHTLEAAIEHLSRNTEVDGIAVFLNNLLGSEELGRLAKSDKRSGQHLRDLSGRAARLNRLLSSVSETPAALPEQGLNGLERPGALDATRLAVQLLGEEAAHDRRARQSAESRARRAERRLAADLNRVRDERDQLALQRDDLDRRRVKGERSYAELEKRHTELEFQHATEVQRLNLERQVVRRELDERYTVLERTHADLEHRHGALESDHGDLKQRHGDLRERHGDLRERHGELKQQYGELEQQHRDLMQQHEEELAELRAMPEWRIGHVLWNKLPLFAKSRRLTGRVYRRIRGSTHPPRGEAVPDEPLDAMKIAAGSTTRFPIISHTFVYQELLALHNVLGADVRLFHTENGDADALHQAFEYLDHNRIQFESRWETHVADFEHYNNTKPGRVESLLVALGEASGMSRGELLRRYELMLAFTSTRQMESWGADYVHTYFFYDQALNGLVASWILDIPRGISAYTDHVMQDWPLKVVPLHLRTADVIVATSDRIRGELLALGGDEIANKIIVKPNGVDGRRFPFTERAPARDRALELICVSRIEPKKGMLDLADAAKILVERGRSVRIHVVGSADQACAGSDDYAAQFERRIEDNGVAEIVVRHGRMRQEELRPLLGQADVFLAPFVETESGDKDGIPTAILEAMSTGLPIVATTAGSIPEIVDDGTEGFLVPQREPAALADAVERFLDDPTLGPKLGTAARARFDRDFDIEATEPRLHVRVTEAVRRSRERRRAAAKGSGSVT